MLITIAKIESVDKVGVWLGANVMLEYTIDEANTVLGEKLTTANKSLVIVEEDLLFLREQITTMEVNIARVYNYEVMMKRKNSAALK